MKLVCEIADEGITLSDDVGTLVLNFPHSNREYTVNYKVVDGEKLQVLSLRNHTSGRDVERCGTRPHNGVSESAEWDDVVMCALELHERLHGRTTAYYDVPVCEGTFSYS
jgi:hypothetical protein